MQFWVERCQEVFSPASFSQQVRHQIQTLLYRASILENPQRPHQLSRPQPSTWLSPGERLATPTAPLFPFLLAVSPPSPMHLSKSLASSAPVPVGLSRPISLNLLFGPVFPVLGHLGPLLSLLQVISNILACGGGNWVVIPHIWSNKCQRKGHRHTSIKSISLSLLAAQGQGSSCGAAPEPATEELSRKGTPIKN